MSTRPRTLYEKIWDAHVVARREDGTCLIYIDRHLVHEVTSPQAFEGLRAAGRKVRRPDLTLAVADHNIPTTARVGHNGHPLAIEDSASAAQLAALEENVREFGVPSIDVLAPEQGIVHVVGPEQGFTLPPRAAPWGSPPRRASLGGHRGGAVAPPPRPRTGRLAPSPSGSAPAKWNTSWPRRRSS